MAIAETVEVVQSALWPQGDIRDPLGVWGFRHGVTGDASGGGIKVTAFVPANRKAAYMYTCYSLNVAQLTGTAITVIIKGRLLTNWPNISDTPGVQAYASLLIADDHHDAGFTAPVMGIRASSPLVTPNDRFVLLFDPRPAGQAVMDIVELEINDIVDLATYSFEGYGYFWDRSVFQAPGGPRHPGAA